MSRSLRVLVVDDSAYNRRTIGELLSTIPEVEVLGKASDGDEALRLAATLQPDLITLDLEMPRMDGFTFLRLLMAKRPTPVIVVSGYSNKENVFRALELGAIDFVAKPTRTVTTDLQDIRQELEEKVTMVRHLAPAGLDTERTGALQRGTTATGAFRTLRGRERDTAEIEAAEEPARLLVVGASTGGPTALVELFARLPANAAVVVAQHMPERFTRTFAERLDRVSRLTVGEISDVGPLRPGTGWVCPGGRCIEVQRRAGKLVAAVVDASESDRYVPSVNRLFTSAAQVLGERVVGVVLTGMGDDGAQGVGVIKERGGRVVAEAPETAVIYGMPGAAMRTGSVDESLALSDLAEALAGLLGS
ncbi:MAG: chemotaxis-specific protein-glutamate methyltransferase CheB [Polyangiales bacterium]